MNYKEKRPWGSFENLLEEENCKVKKIIISPGQSPSYQYHKFRKEYWVIKSGVGEVRLEDQTTEVKEGDAIFVNFEEKHSIRNTGVDDLVFIEVQLGTYFGEDDIVRLEDDYGRN